MRFKALVMAADEIKRAIARISHEILERNEGANDIVVVGILTRGAPMAERIAKNINKFEQIEVPTGVLDITPFRDDISEAVKAKHISKTSIPCPIDGKNIVLVDDVLFTGRTVRAALNSLIEIGRPKSVQLAVLIDRGHRELPIRADFVGKNIPTSSSEIVSVSFLEHDGEEKVEIFSLM